MRMANWKEIYAIYLFSILLTILYIPAVSENRKLILDRLNLLYLNKNSRQAQNRQKRERDAPKKIIFSCLFLPFV